MFKFTNFVTPGIIFQGTVKKKNGGGKEVNGNGSGSTDTTATNGVDLKVFRETTVSGISADEFETKQVPSVMCPQGGSYRVPS